jgi:hypothetical protein
MIATEPVTDLDARFSAESAEPPAWSEARRVLQATEIYWVTTGRPVGRPHVTPLLAVWVDEALYFCTGPDEQKARNVARSPHCILITGCNRLGESKYGPDWHFDVHDGACHHEPGEAWLHEVAPAKILGFRRLGVQPDPLAVPLRAMMARGAR